MKLIVAVTALIAAVALAAPAEAAKKHKKGAYRAHSVHAGAVRVRPAPNPYSVYVGGEYIGSDPDPNIRASLMRNPHNWDGPE